MSERFIDPTSAAEAIHNLDWECSPFARPPPPPIPPFPIIEQTPIVAEDVSLSALEETGEARFAVLEEMAHQDRFVRPSVLNWSISSEEMKEGRCLVAEMGCPGSADLHIKQRDWKHKME
ncbi:hypothetical protein ACJ41O_014567 [Fusarium nematophilum]